MSGFGGPGFQVMDGTGRGLIDVPVEGTSDIYSGQVVCWYRYGVINPGTASGKANISGLEPLYGIVVAGNNKTKVYGTAAATGTAEKTTGVLTAALQLARDWRGTEGNMAPKGDPQAFVKVALIGPETKIRGRIFQSAYGTAPTVTTAASGLSTTGMTGSTITQATVAFNSVFYCRSGANAGLYRVSDTAHATTWVFTKAWPYTIVAGDTFVVGPRQGHCLVQMDSLNMYIDNGSDPTTNNFVINVVTTNLEVAGEEYCEFYFGATHFLSNVS